MNIRERGDSFQVVGMLDGKRVRKQFKTFDEAELYVSATQVRQNQVTRGSFAHLYDLAIQSRETWMSETSKPRANAKLVLDAGDLWSKHIDKVELDELITVFEKFKALGNSGSTINRKKNSISVLFTIARELGFTNKTFSYLKQTHSAESGRERVYTSDEVQGMFAACEDLGFDLLGEMVTILLYGGLRVGELYDIYNKYPKSLNKKTQRLLVHTSKGGANRTILLNDRAYDALTSILKRDSIYSRRLFNSRWATMREYMGMEYDTQFVAHTLRHTCASKLVSLGIQIVKIKEYMGHKNIQTTMKYMHVDEAGLDECAKALTF
jgi:site-specific recombinase XerD